MFMKQKSGILEVPSDDTPINILILTDLEPLFLQTSRYSENISAWTRKILIPNRRDYYGCAYVILKNFPLQAISTISLS